MVDRATFDAQMSFDDLEAITNATLVLTEGAERALARGELRYAAQLHALADQLAAALARMTEQYRARHPSFGDRLPL